ncbi:MAG: cobalt transport protein CbiM [Methanobacterium sp. PtaB.Bin024]|nr:MAG: cobalt transport protein CbiM [Methanobacterium sp. PtaB.Bin024]
MHIPDGFIPLWQCAIYILLMFIAWGFTLKWLVESLIKFEKEKPSTVRIIFYIILTVIILPSFIFVVQAFNIPIPWGVGLSLMGSALVAIIYRSPWGAVMIMSLVLMVQGLLFGDGGLTTLGANIINIGVIGGFTGFYIYKFAKPLGDIPRALIGGWFAGFASLIVVGMAVAFEMALAGTFPLSLGFISQFIYSTVGGIFEGIMTMIGCIILLFLRSEIKNLDK